MTQCSRCGRNLSGEKPVHLPNARDYCAACCESMATEAFEMETGEPFTQWIDKHPKLVMRYQPMELNVRRIGFLFPAGGTVTGLIVFIYGCVKYLQMGLPVVYFAGFVLALVVLGALIAKHEKLSASPAARGALLLVKVLSMTIPVVSLLGIFKFGRPAGFMFVGLFCLAVFGALTVRGLLAYMRAQDFQLTLEDGQFDLHHGKHEEQFRIDDLDRACVVRPGTIGATEGALGFKDGRMLTLDTCLSDLHALGTVLDLHFDREFPPSPDDLAKERRTRLRKIRGLS